jgi:hypothetical protein
MDRVNPEGFPDPPSFARRRVAEASRSIAVLSLVLAVGWVLLPGGAPAEEAEAGIHFEIDGSRWKGARLDGIPKGAEISVKLSTDGQIRVLLLDAESYARFPNHERSVFKGSTSTKLAFTVLAPTTSLYYLLIDNRDGAEKRSVDIEMRAATGNEARLPAPAPPAPESEPALDI